jgi:CHAD domain-containing protein
MDTPETDSLQHIVVLVNHLGDCWERYRRELKRARKDFEDEYVHDLRVSIRRLIAAVEMGRAVAQQKKMKKSRRLLKSYLNAFDILRDTQVQLAIVDEMLAELPEIGDYRDHLRKLDKQQISHLEKKIKKFSSVGLARQFARLSTSLLEKPVPETAIWSVVDDSYAIVVERQLAVRPEDSATIHRMRVAFKKFRYQVEIIHSLLPNAPENLLRRLHDYQAAMGEIQDAEVGLQMLADFVGQHEESLPAVRGRFTEMKQARIAAFIDQIDSLKTFWRPTPGEMFPWEIKKRRKTKRKMALP